MNRQNRSLAIACLAALAVTLAGCATTNRLDRFDFTGSTLAVDMPMPPAPRMQVRYEVSLDRHDLIYSAFSVLTSVAKATQAEIARQNMDQALSAVDVPDLIVRESFSACAAALGAHPEDSGARADFLLVLSIHDWGIDASSPISTVSLRMHLTASLYSTHGSELVWRRDLGVHDNASPAMFGLGPIVGNMVTATALSELSVDELERGFTELGRSMARSIASRLQEDLMSARYGG
jgi:ABC-type uncharacterized transport system auxiliary subunit